MGKKPAVLTALVFFGFIFAVNPVAAGEKIESAEALFEKVIKTYRQIGSYSYTNCEAGYDTVFHKERMKKAKKMIKKDMEEELNVKLKEQADDEPEEKPVLKKSCYTYEFMKPYLCQMVILHSDFTPGILDGSMLTYRPDKNPDVFWAKLKYSPIAIKRSIKSESGGFLSGNWTMTLIGMHHHRLNGTMELAGREKIDGRDTYVLKFSFPDHENLKIYKVDIGKWQIPVEIVFKIKEQLDTLGKEKQTEFTYWIDAERFIILKTQNKIAGEVHWTETFKDIKMNHLTEEDF